MMIISSIGPAALALPSAAGAMLDHIHTLLVRVAVATVAEAVLPCASLQLLELEMIGRMRKTAIVDMDKQKAAILDKSRPSCWTAFGPSVASWVISGQQ